MYILMKHLYYEEAIQGALKRNPFTMKYLKRWLLFTEKANW